MQISSLAFLHDQAIPPMYTCEGKNVNPPLIFEDVPKEAVTLALIMDDPDAPGGTFDHWLIWNMDPHIGEIRENEPPQPADYGLNSFGHQAYGGPCPPSGEHRYRFRLYALKQRLDLDPISTTKEELLRHIKDNLIAESELVGRYQKQA